MSTLRRLLVMVLASTHFSATIFASAVKWSSRDGKMVDYPCNSTLCLSICCHLDEVLINGGCIKDSAANFTSLRIRTSANSSENEEMKPGENFYPFTNDPCHFEWMTSWVSNNFYVLSNGMINASQLGRNSLSGFDRYCLFREPKTANYLVKVCRPWLNHLYWDTICLTISSLTMLVIFLGYTLVPELNNLHGMMFRSYLGSYICVYISAVGLSFMAESKPHAKLFADLLFIMEYFGICCILWLNAMSFDIWRAVRNLQSIDSYNQERKKKKFLGYAIYAWVIPILLVSAYAIALYYIPSLNNVLNRQTFRIYARTGTKSSFFLCNTFFYFSTALIIKRHKEDTVDLTDGVNKHHNADKQWINIHVKLYLIMGGHMIPWICWDLWPMPETTSILVVLEMLQCFIIFFVFLWRDKIKQSLRRQFNRVSAARQSAASSSYATGSTAL